MQISTVWMVSNLMQVISVLTVIPIWNFMIKTLLQSINVWILGKNRSDFPFNEYHVPVGRWRQPLVQRLGDKDYSWNAVACWSLIWLLWSGICLCLSRYDRRGWIRLFLGIDQTKLDQELIVRSPGAYIDAYDGFCSTLAHPRWKASFGYLSWLCSFAWKDGCGYSRSSTFFSTNRRTDHSSYGICFSSHQGFVNCKDQFMLR